jgi:hypothetical protein
VPVPTRLGTACILAAGGYVDGKLPWEERGARRDSVIVKVVVCIVRALRKEGLVGAEMMNELGAGRDVECGSCRRVPCS